MSALSKSVLLTMLCILYNISFFTTSNWHINMTSKKSNNLQVNLDILLFLLKLLFISITQWKYYHLQCTSFCKPYKVMVELLSLLSNCWSHFLTVSSRTSSLTPSLHVQTRSGFLLIFIIPFQLDKCFITGILCFVKIVFTDRALFTSTLSWWWISEPIFHISGLSLFNRSRRGFKITL